MNHREERRADDPAKPSNTGKILKDMKEITGRDKSTINFFSGTVTKADKTGVSRRDKYMMIEAARRREEKSKSKKADAECRMA